MAIDLFLFLFCSTILLSFSISLLDGYLLYCLLWLSSIFYNCSFSDFSLPWLVRIIWLIFFIGILVGRFFYSTSYRNQYVISNSTIKLPQQLSRGYSIKPVILLMFMLSVVVNLVLLVFSKGIFNLDNLHNSSKLNIYIYSTEGLIASFQLYVAYSVLFLANFISIASLKVFFQRFLILNAFLGSFANLKYISLLASYGHQLIMPFVNYLSLIFFNSYRWKSVLLGFKHFSIKKIQLFSGLVFSLIILFIFLNYLYRNLNFLDFILYKSLNRSEVYEFIDDSSLKTLISNYSGNYLYILHPFLLLFGLPTYSIPMGTSLIYKTFSETSIGGPNVHLPLATYIISAGGLWGLSSILFVGFLCGFLLSHTRFILMSTPVKFNYNSLYWSIFFFFSFLKLLTEPSAFGHTLFFATILFFILKFFKLLNILRPI